MAASFRISAIIPAYNSAAYIRDALESVLKQSHPVDEILVVDDGSTDDTAVVVSSYFNSGVKYIHQENQGPGAARNLGLRHTSGELVAFLDADDLWTDDKIQLQEGYLTAHPDVGVVSGPKICWEPTDGDSRWIESDTIFPETKLKLELLINNVIGNPSMTLIRRSVLEKVGGFNPDLRWGEDWELWIRISNCSHFGYVDEPTIIYRKHPESLMHQSPMKSIDCLLDISRNAIRTTIPTWLQPVLLSRACSKAHLLRALYALKKHLPHQQQIYYALAAFFLYPWQDDPSIKFRTVVRAMVGDTSYQKIKYQLRKRLHSVRQG